MDRRQLDACVYILKSLTNAAITFIINHPPRINPAGHDSKGAKILPSGQSLCTKTFPMTKQGVKSPTPKTKLGNFTDVFINSLTLAAFLSQQIKLFFNKDTDHCNTNYIICWSLYSTYGHKSFI